MALEKTQVDGTARLVDPVAEPEDYELSLIHI